MDFITNLLYTVLFADIQYSMKANPGVFSDSCFVNYTIFVIIKSVEISLKWKYQIYLKFVSKNGILKL